MNIEIHLADIQKVTAADNGYDLEEGLATTVTFVGDAIRREQFINDLLEAEDDLGSEAMFAMLKRIADDKEWELSERDPGPVDHVEEFVNGAGGGPTRSLCTRHMVDSRLCDCQYQVDNRETDDPKLIETLARHAGLIPSDAEMGTTS